MGDTTNDHFLLNDDQNISAEAEPPHHDEEATLPSPIGIGGKHALQGGGNVLDSGPLKKGRTGSLGNDGIAV